MSFQHCHWRRNNTTIKKSSRWSNNYHWDKEDDDASIRLGSSSSCCEFVKGSPIEQINSMINNPQSNLSMLNGFQDSILPIILSYTEYVILPCTCCTLPLKPQAPPALRERLGSGGTIIKKKKTSRKNDGSSSSSAVVATAAAADSSVVVFCCRQQKRVLRDLSHKTTIPPSTKKDIDLTFYRSEFLWHLDDISVLCVSCGSTNGTPAPWDIETEEAFAAEEVKYGYTTYLAITEKGIYSREMALSWDDDFTPDTICFGISKCRKLLHIGKCTKTTSTTTSTNDTKQEGAKQTANNETTTTTTTENTQYTGFIFFIESKVLTRRLLRFLKRVKRLKLRQQQQQELESSSSTATIGVILQEEEKNTPTTTLSAADDDSNNLLLLSQPPSLSGWEGKGPVLRESSHLVDMLS